MVTLSSLKVLRALRPLRLVRRANNLKVYKLFISHNDLF